MWKEHHLVMMQRGGNKRAQQEFGVLALGLRGSEKYTTRQAREYKELLKKEAYAELGYLMTYL
jgi:hypothetical protein